MTSRMPSITYLNDNMAIEAVDRNVGAFGCARIAAFESEIPSEIASQGVKITFRLLDLRLLLGTTGFCDKVYRELVRGCTTDKIGEICELEFVIL